MRRGVVLELRDGRAVVLDTSGGFQDVEAHPSWRAGDVVPLPAARLPHRKALLLAACLTLCLLGISAGLWFPQAALVSLDVNPSVELSLNRFHRVVSFRGLNEEGEALLSSSHIWGKRCEDALTALLESEYLSPYLSDAPDVVLTVQAGSEEQSLASLVAAYASGAVGQEVQVDCHSVDSALVEEAHHYGVTAGKYLALLKLQAVNPAADLGDFAQCAIGEIQAETDRCQSACDTDNAQVTPSEETVIPSQTPTHHSDGHHSEDHG